MPCRRPTFARRQLESYVSTPHPVAMRIRVWRLTRFCFADSHTGIRFAVKSLRFLLGRSLANVVMVTTIGTLVRFVRFLRFEAEAS